MLIFHQLNFQEQIWLKSEWEYMIFPRKNASHIYEMYTFCLGINLLYGNINDLVQECSNSISYALELLQSGTELWIYLLAKQR